jgi:hypothetical protein
MQFELVDSLSLPGAPEKPNEDAFAHRPNFAVVFDGATPLSESLLPGPSDAQWIARFGANRLAAHAEGRVGTPRDWLRKAAADASASFRALRRRAPEAPHQNPLASLMGVAVVGSGLEALWFGDCALIAKNSAGRVRLIGDTVARRDAERARVRKMAGAAGRSPTAAGLRAEFLPALRAARDHVNSPRGGWLFAPDPACAEHAHSQALKAAAGDLLLLATDGFLTLISDYERYDPKGLIEAAEADGLERLGRELRRIERADPDGKNYPRFKKSDDATAILLRIGE